MPGLAGGGDTPLSYMPGGKGGWGWIQCSLVQGYSRQGGDSHHIQTKGERVQWGSNESIQAEGYKPTRELANRQYPQFGILSTIEYIIAN